MFLFFSPRTSAVPIASDSYLIRIRFGLAQCQSLIFLRIHGVFHWGRIQLLYNKIIEICL